MRQKQNSCNYTVLQFIEHGRGRNKTVTQLQFNEQSTTPTSPSSLSPLSVLPVCHPCQSFQSVTRPSPSSLSSTPVLPVCHPSQSFQCVTQSTIALSPSSLIPTPPQYPPHPPALARACTITHTETSPMLFSTAKLHLSFQSRLTRVCLGEFISFPVFASAKSSTGAKRPTANGMMQTTAFTVSAARHHVVANCVVDQYSSVPSVGQTRHMGEMKTVGNFPHRALMNRRDFVYSDLLCGISVSVHLIPRLPPTLRHSSQLMMMMMMMMMMRIIIIIIMYIYHALINALSAHMIHINLNMIFYTHVEHSSTKTSYIKYYKILL